jgi:hypothetical protein
MHRITLSDWSAGFDKLHPFSPDTTILHRRVGAELSVKLTLAFLNNRGQHMLAAVT